MHDGSLLAEVVLIRNWPPKGMHRAKSKNRSPLLDERMKDLGHPASPPATQDWGRSRPASRPRASGSDLARTLCRTCLMRRRTESLMQTTRRLKIGDQRLARKMRQ